MTTPKPDNTPAPLSPQHLERLGEAIEQVCLAAVDVPDYDDESETLAFHGQALESANTTLRSLRKDLAHHLQKTTSAQSDNQV